MGAWLLRAEPTFSYRVGHGASLLHVQCRLAVVEVHEAVGNLWLLCWMVCRTNMPAIDASQVSSLSS